MQKDHINSKDIVVDASALRRTILRIIHDASASHIGSSLSVVEILNAVYSLVDIEKIKKQSNDRDRIVLSKGHGAGALYTVLSAYGLIPEEELASYCKNGSAFAGLASCNVKYVDQSTGSLGHGLSVAVGMAYGLKKQHATGNVFVILGDGELHEGSNWEALMLASTLKLDNLLILIDNNGLSGIDKSNCCELGDIHLKFKAFGVYTEEVNGHDESAIREAINNCKKTAGPAGIICNTVKGKGVSFMEHENVWHYRPVNAEMYQKALIEIKK